MLRGTNALLRSSAMAFANGKSLTSSTTPLHRLSAPNGLPKQLQRTLPAVWRTQYSSKPYISPSEIKKHEEEVAQRKLEAHPENVTATSTTTSAYRTSQGLLEDEQGTQVTKKDQEEVMGALKNDINTVVETVALTAVPHAYYRLGLAGTIPYVFTSLSTVYLSWNLNTAWPTDNQLLNSVMVSDRTAHELLAHLEPIQLGYGAVIISFLGAIHWGLELAEKSPLQPRTNFRYAMGVLAPALAWPTLMLPIEWALTGQFAAFVGLYFADAQATTRGWAPTWYGTYRWVLTAIVGGSIVVSLIGRFKVGNEGSALSTQGLRDTMTKSTVGAEPYKNWEKKEAEEKKRIKEEKEREERKKKEAEKKLKEKEKKEGKEGGKDGKGENKDEKGEKKDGKDEKKDEGKEKEKKDGKDEKQDEVKEKEKKD